MNNIEQEDLAIEADHLLAGSLLDSITWDGEAFTIVFENGGKIIVERLTLEYD